MDRADLAALIRNCGCTVTRENAAGFPLEFDCEDAWSKVRMLDALAWVDARYDPRVRAVALAIIAPCRDTRPRTVAEALHRAVKRRVRYIGEGIETFQSAWQTWGLRLGDCDDSARLLVALARALGQPAHVVALASKRTGDPAHAVAVVSGAWCDATIDAATGEHPRAAWARLKRAGRAAYNYGGEDMAGPSGGHHGGHHHGGGGHGGRRGGWWGPWAYAPPCPYPTWRQLPDGSTEIQCYPDTVSERSTLGDIGDVNDGARFAARQALEAAWPTVPGLPAVTEASLQMVQSVALGGEGSDGSGCWTNRGSAPPCPGVCHNWAGLQLPGSQTTHDGSVPTCPPGSAPCTDRLADGSPFGVCFKTYTSQAEGARDYLQRLLVTHGVGPVVGSGNADLVARVMYESHYFTGTQGTDEERIAAYAANVASAAERISTSLDEPLLVTRGDPEGGASGADVASRALALAALGLVGWYGYRRGWHKKAATAARGLAARVTR